MIICPKDTKLNNEMPKKHSSLNATRYQQFSPHHIAAAATAVSPVEPAPLTPVRNFVHPDHYPGYTSSAAAAATTAVVATTVAAASSVPVHHQVCFLFATLILHVYKSSYATLILYISGV